MMKLLHITFDDPQELESWSTKDEVLRDLTGENHAVGWLIHETKTHLYLCPHFTGDQFSSTLKVNKKIISKIKKL